VPLLLLDLDNTLLDRAAAFRAAAREFLRQLDAPASDEEWLLDADEEGRAPRREIAQAIKARYGLTLPAEDLAEALRDAVVRHSRLDPLVACAIEIAGNAGWVPVIVSNGAERQQEAKIRSSGLDQYVADWVISEEAGVSKPDPRIFAIAAERVRLQLRGAWMIGDSPEADIGGAHAAGLRSVWLHRGRRWTETRFQPTVTADSPISALAAVLHHA
jgi:putative hydrolase of the HAD superfamily